MTILLLILILISGVYTLKKKRQSKFSKIMLVILISTMIILLLYIFIYSDSLKSRVNRYYNLKSINEIVIDSIIYKSDLYEINIKDKSKIENICMQISNMQSTFEIKGGARGEKPFFLILFKENEVLEKLELYYNVNRKLIIEVRGVGSYRSPYLNYYLDEVLFNEKQ